jgi:beta-lactamase regulating signal transducer with metallopeptidase domain
MDPLFLQHTGRTLLVSILQFSVLYLLYLIFKNTVLRNISARTDHNILLLLLFTGTGFFISGICNNPSQNNTGFFPFDSKTPAGWMSLASPILYWIAVIYFLVAGARILLSIRHLFFLRRQHEMQPVVLAPDFTEFLQTFCAHIRIRMPQVLSSEKHTVPFVSGFLEHIIIIPTSLQHCFTPQEMEAVILHELAHLKRYDIYLNALVVFCSHLLFFNPFAVLLIRRLRQQREVACDDWVLAQSVKPVHYATALYKTARNQAPAWLLAMGAKKGELYTRIERLFSANKQRHPYHVKWWPFVAILFCAPFIYQPATTTKKDVFTAGRAPVTQPVAFNEKRLPAIVNKYQPLSKITLVPVKREPKIVVHEAEQTPTVTVKRYPVNETATVVVVPVSETTTNEPTAVFVSDGTKRNEDIVLRFSDSVNLYAGFITRTNVEDITNKQLEKVMNLVALGLNDAVTNTFYFESPAAPVTVSSDGEKNLYFSSTTVQQQARYDAYYQQWKIRFTIMNGDQRLGERFVTIYQRRQLQSVRL